jgi:CHASE3 domain sensor protein
MKVDLSKKIRGGYLAAFMLLLFSYSLTIVSTKQLVGQNSWVNHSREVINKLELLLSYLKDSEIGLRGFLLMKDEKYLLPYYTSEKKVDSLFTLVHSETSDNGIQQGRLAIVSLPLLITEMALTKKGCQKYLSLTSHPSLMAADLG